MMLEMDGFEVVAALHKQEVWRDNPVIVITSLDLNANDRARLNSGVQSVLARLELLGEFEVPNRSNLIDSLQRCNGSSRAGSNAQIKSGVVS
jgi:CheY-like chemotaxis protein